MSVILAFYEGLLANRHDEPIQDGYRLLYSLSEFNRIIVATSGSQERVEHQLKSEKMLTVVSEIIDKTADLPPLPLWERQIEVIRSRYPVSHVLTANPEVAQYAVEHGIVSLFYAHPSFSQPAIRPQVGNRKWEDLVLELDARP